MKNSMSYPRLYLASKSPRRRLLIEQIGISYQVLDVQVDEQPLPNEPGNEFVARLALQKARAGWNQVEDGAVPVVGADTCILLNNHIIGKPRSKEQCIQWLQQYSGATHTVLTGVALVGSPMAVKSPDKVTAKVLEQVRVSASSVTFRVLTVEECEKYWLSGEPKGKAGGYAIQGKGAGFIKTIHGSYSGIMGLPLCELTELMDMFGIPLFD